MPIYRIINYYDDERPIVKGHLLPRRTGHKVVAGHGGEAVRIAERQGLAGPMYRYAYKREILCRISEDSARNSRGGVWSEDENGDLINIKGKMIAEYRKKYPLPF